MSTTYAEDDRDTITVSRGESTDLFVAKDETTGVVSQGETKAEALVNLADALELYDRPDPERNLDDSLFAGEAFMSIDMDDESIDDVLYGRVDAANER